MGGHGTKELWLFFSTTIDINPAIVIIDLLPLLPCPLSLIPLLLILLSLIEILYLLLPSQSPTITSVVAAAAYLTDIVLNTFGIFSSDDISQCLY